MRLILNSILLFMCGRLNPTGKKWWCLKHMLPACPFSNSPVSISIEFKVNIQKAPFIFPN